MHNVSKGACDRVFDRICCRFASRPGREDLATVIVPNWRIYHWRDLEDKTGGFTWGMKWEIFDAGRRSSFSFSQEFYFK